MSHDISQLLKDWEYNPDHFTARVCRGDDGQEKIQLRLELGVLQLEMDGRPDGTRVEDFDSWLDHFEHHQQKHDAENPDATPFQLEPEDCQRLLRECIQYYQRFTCFWHLERYELCARDTKRNLRLIAFVREHARRDRDRLQFDQWRPYLTMMHTKAVATPLVLVDDSTAASAAIEAGIQRVLRYLNDYGQSEHAEKSEELVYLKKWLGELKGTGDGKPLALQPPPKSPLDHLRDDLNSAVAEERYEDAARLRDEIEQSGDPPVS